MGITDWVGNITRSVPQGPQKHGNQHHSTGCQDARQKLYLRLSGTVSVRNEAARAVHDVVLCTSDGAKHCLAPHDDTWVVDAQPCNCGEDRDKQH